MRGLFKWALMTVMVIAAIHWKAVRFQLGRISSSTHAVELQVTKANCHSYAHLTGMG